MVQYSINMVHLKLILCSLVAFVGFATSRIVLVEKEVKKTSTLEEKVKQLKLLVEKEVKKTSTLEDEVKQLRYQVGQIRKDSKINTKHLADVDNYVIFPYPKPGVDLPWVDFPLLSNESSIEKTSFIGLLNVEKEYRVTFSVKPQHTKLGTILTFYAGSTKTGDGGLSIFIENNTLIAVTFVSGKQVQFKCKTITNWGDWNFVEFSQEKVKGGQYKKMMKLNDETCGSAIDKLPGVRTAVSVYVNNPWHHADNGSISNVTFSLRPEVKYGRKKIILKEGIATFEGYGRYKNGTSEPQPRVEPWTLEECAKQCNKDFNSATNHMTYNYKDKTCFWNGDAEDGIIEDNNTELSYRIDG